jgi:predicted MFS family arabinose efflux permease
VASNPASNPTPALALARAFWLALALSMGAAVSLGITRFAYGLLLPPMRIDLAWSYTLAGAMNTANALGYLLGALMTPWLLRRVGAGRTLIAGAVLASVFMAGSGFFVTPALLLAQRLLAGLASAWIFIAGGLMAAGLAARVPARAGLLLGLYYGGTGFGIVASALLVPAAMAAAMGEPHAWRLAWWALAAACALGTAGLAWPARVLGEAGPLAPGTAPTATPAATSAAPPDANTALDADARRLAWALAGYTLFGVGYIGYMTFVIALLREQGVAPAGITAFYALLGVAVVASSRIWAGLLDRSRGGQALAMLNALLGVATVLPVFTRSWPWLLVSGLMFGGIFLSVVASTTALVRHNLPPARWAAGISAFTIVFAAGQIVGPTVVGWIADGPGGLTRGLLFSAAALWVGAALASRQRPLAPSELAST